MLAMLARPMVAVVPKAAAGSAPLPFGAAPPGVGANAPQQPMPKIEPKMDADDKKVKVDWKEADTDVDSDEEEVKPALAVD